MKLSLAAMLVIEIADAPMLVTRTAEEDPAIPIVCEANVKALVDNRTALRGTTRKIVAARTVLPLVAMTGLVVPWMVLAVLWKEAAIVVARV